MRLVVDRQGSDPERGSQPLYERLTAAGIEVCVVRATVPRVQVGPLGADGATRWNLRALGHIDHRKVAVIDGRIGWVGGAGIEDHFEDGRFHDLFVRVDGPGRPAAAARLRRRLPLARRACAGGRPGDALPGGGRRGRGDPRRRPAQRAGALPADQRCDRAHARELAGDARRGQSLRHRPRHDPARRAGCAPRCPRAAVRPREREQLGVRSRAAVPPRHAARRRRADPRVPDHAPCQGVRARRRGAARGNLQPRGLEPEAVLRDRPPAPLDHRRRAVRGAVQRAGRGRVVSRAPAHRHGASGPARERSRPSRRCSDSRADRVHMGEAARWSWRAGRTRRRLSR